MRVAPKIVLADEVRQTLERWSHGRSTPARQVLRAKIVLAAAEGKENQAIAEELKTDRMLVGLWRKRFFEKGLAGIEKDAPRSGRNRILHDQAHARFRTSALTSLDGRHQNLMISHLGGLFYKAGQTCFVKNRPLARNKSYPRTDTSDAKGSFESKGDTVSKS